MHTQSHRSHFLYTGAYTSLTKEETFFIQLHVFHLIGTGSPEQTVREQHVCCKAPYEKNILTLLLNPVQP